MEKPFEDTLEKHLKLLSECIESYANELKKGGSHVDINELYMLNEAFNRTFEVWKNY